MLICVHAHAGLCLIKCVEDVKVPYVSKCTSMAAGTTIWSPLASGVLSGKYSKGNVPADSRLAMEAYKVLPTPLPPPAPPFANLHP